MEKQNRNSLIEALTIAAALLLLLPAISFANEQAASTAELSQVAEPKKSSITGSLAISRSNSLYVVNGNTTSASWDFAGTLAKDLGNKLSVSAILEGSQDLKDSEASDLSRARIIFAKSGYSALNNRLSLTPKLALRGPVSRAENSASFQGGLTPSISVAANPDHLPSKKLSLGAALSLTRSFHKFETGVNGKVNGQYGSVQVLTAGWAFSDKLSMYLEFDHINSINYQGRMSESYAHIQQVAYAINQNIEVALGHQYGNPSVSSLKADEQSLNYNLTDEDNSIGYGTLTLSF
jgi:hypothetical protein